MAHKRKTDDVKGKAPYTIEDALKVADDIFNLNREKKYDFGAFAHGLIFASEYLQFSYKIPPQQIADIRRGCRKYFKEIENVKTTNKKEK